jgi:hypothetical protein
LTDTKLSLGIFDAYGCFLLVKAEKTGIIGRSELAGFVITRFLHQAINYNAVNASFDAEFQYLCLLFGAITDRTEPDEYYSQRCSTS